MVEYECLVYLQDLQNWLHINNSYLQQFLSITLYLNNHIFLWPWQHFYSCVHMKSNTCPDIGYKKYVIKVLDFLKTLATNWNNGSKDMTSYGVLHMKHVW